MILQDNLDLAQYVGKDPSVPFSVAVAVKAKVVNDRLLKNITPLKHWQMYMGNHQAYFVQRHNEDAELFKYRQTNPVIANYTRYVVDTAAKFLYGRASKVSRRFGNNKDVDLRMRQMLRCCDYDKLMLEARKKTGIFGEVGFRNVAIDSRTGGQPADGLANPYTYAHPILLDPSRSYFLVNTWNQVTAVVIENDVRDWATGMNKRVIELIVDDSRWLWLDGILESSSANTYSISEEFVVAFNNELGFDDIQTILDLNIKLDEALTDNSAFFAKHGWPQLMSSVDLSKVQNTPNHVWEIPSEGNDDKIKDKVFYLTWDGRMEDAAKHIEFLEALIFKLSSTARIATGDLQAIGQLRSGPAIVTAHSPSIQKTQADQVMWGSNETRLLKAMAAFESRLQGKTVDARYPEMDISIIYPRDFVPGEELVRSQVQQAQINSHLRTMEDLIRENHPEFTDTEVEEYRAQIVKDSEELIDSAREFISKQAGAPSGQSGPAAQKAVEQKTAQGN